MITEICGAGVTGAEASRQSRRSRSLLGGSEIFRCGHLRRGGAVVDVRAPHGVRHDEVWPAFGLVVDPPDVLADEAHEEELDAREERDRHDERGEALGRRAQEETLEDGIQGVERGRSRCERAEEPGRAERRDREREHAVEREPEELPERVARLAAGSSITFDRNPRLLEADPGPQSPDVAMTFG